jgi:hypothetical protein
MQGDLRALSAFCGLSLGVVLHAQVIPVSGNGPALAAAVAAAPSGATLVVAAGAYDGFLVIDKDLTIVAPARAMIVGTIEATAGATRRTLELVELDIVPGPFGTIPGLVKVADNLHMVDCVCRAVQVGAPSSTTLTNYCWLERCSVYGASVPNSMYANAVLVDCSIQSGSYQSGVYGLVPQRGLFMSGSLRAERTVFVSSAGATISSSIAALDLWGTATLANCTMIVSAPGQYGLVTWGNVTRWATTIYGYTFAPNMTTRLLATAQWTQRNWTTGGTSQVTFHETPNTAVAMVVSLGLSHWTSAFAAEPLWVGSTPDFGIWSVGVSDAQGNHSVAVTIPNVPALQYSEAWLTGLFFDPLPLRTTVPIGGLIQ